MSFKKKQVHHVINLLVIFLSPKRVICLEQNAPIILIHNVKCHVIK